MTKLALTFLTLLIFNLTGCKNENDAEPVINTYKKETVQYKTITGTDANLVSLDVYHYNKLTQSKPCRYLGTRCMGRWR